MKKRINQVTLYSFLSLVFVIGILNLFSPVSEFSDNENRPLGQFPTFSFERLFEGKYISEFETYIQDQFIMRDNWIVIKALSNQALLKIENNGVYMADDYQLIKQFMFFNEERLKNNINYINRLETPTSLMIVPTASEIDKKQLPRFSYNTNQADLLAYAKKQVGPNIQFIDMLSMMENKTDSYFKTDHHWNAKGAYIGYQSFIESQNQVPIDYTFVKVSDNFKGTLFSKSGLFYYPTDEIYAAKELKDMEVSVLFEDGGRHNRVYFEENLAIKDQYTYFLDGNHAYVEILNENASNDDTLLVVKDSYAHIMVPYLASHYKRIIMVDLRYYRFPLSALIKDEAVDHTLVLYSLDNLCTDSNLAFIK